MADLHARGCNSTVTVVELGCNGKRPTINSVFHPWGEHWLFHKTGAHQFPFFFIVVFAALDCKYQERHNTWSPCRRMDKGPIQHAQCCIKDHCISRVNMTPTFEHSLAIHGLHRTPGRRQCRICLSNRKWGAMLHLTTLHPAIRCSHVCTSCVTARVKVAADVGAD